MKKILVHEYLKVIDGVINFSHEFDLNTVKIENDIEYELVSSNSVRVDNEYDNLTLAVTYYITCSDRTSIISNIPKEDSIYKTFSKTTQLYKNNKFKVHLEICNNTYDKEFYSTLDPFYSKIKTVRNDTGNLLDDIDDEVIALYIHENSLDAFNLLKNNSDDEDVVVTNAARQYARYKTDLDLLNASYLTIVSKYGVSEKKILSLDIKEERELPELDDMMKYFKDKVSQYEEELQGSSETVAASFQKASSTSYPIDSRNSF